MTALPGSATGGRRPGPTSGQTRMTSSPTEGGRGGAWVRWGGTGGGMDRDDGVAEYGRGRRRAVGGGGGMEDDGSSPAQDLILLIPM